MVEFIKILLHEKSNQVTFSEKSSSKNDILFVWMILTHAVMKYKMELKCHSLMLGLKSSWRSVWLLLCYQAVELHGRCPGQPAGIHGYWPRQGSVNLPAHWLMEAICEWYWSHSRHVLTSCLTWPNHLRKLEWL